ncbi:MAG TPA: PadR family transcriptional regulator [Actinomycetes bacterium]
MSIRNGILALVVEQPRHGYQVKTDFEHRTGGTWPLNIGQVYTTLARLERDGLVRVVDDGDASRIVYGATDAGRAVVREWFSTPVRRTQAPRDELAIKLALAVGTPGVEVAALVQTQRSEAVRGLQELTRLKANASEDDDLAWLLVVDALVFQAEAEVRWLDHCEARLVRAAASPRQATTPQPSAHQVTETAR